MRIIEIQGDSMIPTLMPSQFILTRPFARSRLQLGTIVFFRLERKLLVKRIFGLPDQEIFIDKGQLIVDGKKQGLHYNDTERNFMWVVPADHVILLGDNPNNSLDSRSFGPIPIERLEDIAIWRLWPPKKL